MFGWIVTNKKNSIDFTGFSKVIEADDLIFAQKHNNRFVNDAIFQEDSNYIVIVDGIITNKKELLEAYTGSWKDKIIDLYCKEGYMLADKLRGQFSGMIYDKITKEVFFYTNHIGDGGVFYRNEDDGLIISTNFNWIVKTLRKNNIQYYFCEEAVKYMCTFGFMLDRSTFVDKVYKLTPSQCALIKDNQLTLKCYHKWTNTNLNDDNEEETIEKIDKFFRQAIKRNFDKDREYGLHSVVDLSGGLDARVVNFVAKDMGYEMTNISFSQKNSDEYKAMKKLNKALGNKLIYFPLDKAEHIYLVDKIVSLNYGLSFFAGAGGLVNILEDLDLNYYGIEHGGVLGEMAEGVFPGRNYLVNTKPSIKNGMAFGKTISMDILDETIVDKFENTEMFQIFGRGLMGGALPQLIRRQYTGYLSPYEDIDFYDYYLSIPLMRRGKDQILAKWIMKKYPQAYDVIEDKLMCKPSASKFVKSIMIFRRKVKGKLAQHLGMKVPYFMKNNMNPMEYWYITDEKLRQFIDDYYKENIEKLLNYSFTYETINTLFEKGEIKEKLIAMTVLSVVKQYF